jgi:hypothetical protein
MRHESTQGYLPRRAIPEAELLRLNISVWDGNVTVNRGEGSSPGAPNTLGGSTGMVDYFWDVLRVGVWRDMKPLPLLSNEYFGTAREPGSLQDLHT